MLIWLFTFLVGLGSFRALHCQQRRILAAVLQHEVTVSQYFAWLLPAVLGNITGGVLIVTLLEYGQVKGGEQEGHGFPR